ncbi:unnamed protein product, partial [Ectocarpus fasciculatus]
MVGVADDTKHFGFWSLTFSIQKAGWRSWHYSVPAVMSFGFTDHVPSFAKATELLFFASPRALDLSMARWPLFYSMMALWGVLIFSWLLITLCRRLWLRAGAVANQREEETGRWQRE